MRTLTMTVVLLFCLGPAKAQDDPPPSGRGITDILGNRLNGEPLRPLRPGERRAAGREAVASALATTDGRALGAHQRGRVLPAYDALAPRARDRFDALLAGTTRPEVRAQLVKALTAGSSIDELEWLAAKLAPQDAAWIARMTRLTGDDGVVQQFGTSCVPATAQALRAEYDPVYALRTRLENGDVHAVDDDDPTRLNPALAREQKEWLEQRYDGQLAHLRGARGEALPRSDEGGRGMPLDQVANSLKKHTGLSYDLRGALEGDAAVRLLDEHLAQGRAMPARLTDLPGELMGHAVLFTSMRKERDGSRSFLLHDPWKGQAKWVTERQVRDQDMGLGRSGKLARVFALLVPR